MHRSMTIAPWRISEMFSCLGTSDWLLKGTVDNEPYSPRGIAWFLAGHTTYHMNVARAEYV
jgi:hypothetical protein